MDPVILFFLLGALAGLFKSDLRMPPAVYDLLSMVLLLTIGLKGGVELAEHSVGGLIPQIGLVLLLGFTVPLVIFPLVRFVGRMPRADAASIAAHYGSVSVATYAVGVAFLESQRQSFDPQLPLFVVLLEVPAIMVGILLARGFQGGTRWGPLAHEIFMGKSIVLLLGGLLIGWVAGAEGVQPLEPLFFDLFKGVLALFLLEMGLIAASQARTLRNHGLFLVLLGVMIPVPLATAGAWLGWMMGLNVGGVTLLAVLAGSCSYIAAPAAMRIAVPAANPALSLTASLGVTFPFNIFLGIPLYYQIAQWLHGQ
ncbi:MAG: sodium-dependent bicarbonate transport family permease [Xanthomonadales bacterium]|nr:sodium-dependent bicarbonate transport family permease [Xanthomonadales bacterium]